MQLWVSCKSNHLISFLSKNKQNYLLCLEEKYKIQLRIKQRFTVFPLHVLIRTFLKCLHLVISSDFLFNMLLSLMWLITQSFSVKHNLQIVELALPWTLSTTFHWLLYLIRLLFKFQIYFVNSILYWYLIYLTSRLWLL